jgi:hypothetical protein
MTVIIERFKGQRVILHLAPNWRLVGTILAHEHGLVELADDKGVAIEPYRVQGGSGHYI